MADGPERDMFGFRLPERSTMAIVRRVEGMGDDPLPIGALLGPVLICLAVGAPIGAVIAALTHGDPTIALIWPMMPFASAHVSGVRHRWLALVVAGIAGLSAGNGVAELVDDLLGRPWADLCGGSVGILVATIPYALVTRLPTLRDRDGAV